MPGIERDGEELTRLSPGVGCDSTAQGDKVTTTLLGIIVRDLGNQNQDNLVINTFGT